MAQKILIGIAVAGLIAACAYGQGTPLVHIEDWSDVGCADGSLTFTIRLHRDTKTVAVNCE